jgi:hypothetical protein
MIEFRFVWDCESMEKVLQYRNVVTENTATKWQTVPTVLGAIYDDGEVVVNGDQE